MGFNSVYQTLKEMFPQVDARILKAVAIEHSKNPEGAVESILTEVLPSIRDQSNIHSSAVENNGKRAETTSPSSSVPISTEGEDANASDMLNDGHTINSVCLSKTLDDSLASSFYDANDTDDQLSGNTKNEDLISFRQSQETVAEADQGKMLDAPLISFRAECSENDSTQPFGNHVGEGSVPSHEFHDTGVNVNKIDNASSFSSKVDDGESEGSLSNCCNKHSGRFNGYPSYDLNTTLNFDDHEEKEFLDCNSAEDRNSTEQVCVCVKDHIVDALGNGVPLSDGENQELSNYANTDFEQESSVTDAVGAEDETVLSTIVTRSGQICRINLLQDIIEDAKSYKDALFSTMESVITFIKEVELRENEAQDAKQAAARGGLDILEKVEELKRMLKHAKEANDMHAGEVYGERSILATELRELQTRLLGLSDEKDKSISILDEMRETLEARLVVAEEERKAAEQELLEKEGLARGAFAEQELIMEKVVQESKMLQLEAEENANLRDFLMDKGRLVDILQGEISVICQDVKSLKENFDNRVSLSKSLSFKQTSCRLASSNYSVKSTASAQTESSESPSRLSRATSAECQTPRSSVDEEGVKAAATATAAARKEVSDEDWELCDI